MRKLVIKFLYDLPDDVGVLPLGQTRDGSRVGDWDKLHILQIGGKQVDPARIGVTDDDAAIRADQNGLWEDEEPVLE